MPDSIKLAILILFGMAMTFILLYSVIQLRLVFHYLKRKVQKARSGKKSENMTIYPFVTIQLPVYNEKYVIERLLRSVASFDYPKSSFEIQILDDSDDETSTIIEKTIEELIGSKIEITHVKRTKRDGYKAGALQNGLQLAKGEFITIFDADFVPRPDFLKMTVPCFRNNQTGLVQARWEHINEEYSLLTKLQAFGLDAHFSVEQSGRNEGGHFINFNGTAGIWRKTCIESSGGWQSDTLTEDLDLSYRAQLNGWKFEYIEECGAPAELPAEMNALKTQQYRWTKGAAQCSRKNLGKLLHSDKFSLATKVNGFFHLLNSSLFICILLAGILSFPVLLIKHNAPEFRIVYGLSGVFITGLIFLTAFYYTSHRSKAGGGFRNALNFLARFPLFLSVSMGLSLHNGIAAIEGLMGRKSPFLRTPKFNIVAGGDEWRSKSYKSKRFNGLTTAEALLAVYFTIAFIVSVRLADFALMPFLLMLSAGYSYVAALSFLHARR